jgi:hypothetical protein
MGRPLYIERLGQLQVDELLKITTMDRMLLYHVQEWEIVIDWKLPACSKKAGIDISQSLTILDMKGVVMFHTLFYLILCILLYLEMSWIHVDFFWYIGSCSMLLLG